MKIFSQNKTGVKYTYTFCVDTFCGMSSFLSLMLFVLMHLIIQNFNKCSEFSQKYNHFSNIPGRRFEKRLELLEKVSVSKNLATDKENRFYRKSFE